MDDVGSLPGEHGLFLHQLCHQISTQIPSLEPVVLHLKKCHLCSRHYRKTITHFFLQINFLIVSCHLIGLPTRKSFIQ